MFVPLLHSSPPLCQHKVNILFHGSLLASHISVCCMLFYLVQYHGFAVKFPRRQKCYLKHAAHSYIWIGLDEYSMFLFVSFLSSHFLIGTSVPIYFHSHLGEAVKCCQGSSSLNYEWETACLLGNHEIFQAS